MPRYGDLAPHGLLRYGGNETDAQKLYRAMADGLRSAFDVSQGTHVEASIYARARAFAAARATMRHGRDQKHPAKAVEMIPALERQFRLVPTHGQSEEDRRNALKARKLLSRGPRRESLESAIAATVGADNFVSLRVVDASEAEQWPAAPEDVGAFDAPSRAQKQFLMLTHVSVLGAVVFSYEHLGDDDGSRILKGERYCFELENSGLAEAVDITSADPDTMVAIATFTKSHGVGASIASYAPLVTNTQRTLIVGLTSTAARDPVIRRKLDDLLRRMARSITRWFIVEETTTGEAGPFVVGVSRVGVTPIGSTALTL